MSDQSEAGRSPDSGLWEAFGRGDRLACARLISWVENVPEALPAIRDRLIPHRHGAVRIGITGPPGVGKSTVTAALARRASRSGRKVGVLAVDPTSPFSGGAFLGDRVRMQELVDDPGIFIRSLASRDGHGGLSPATPHAADVLDAFGMDRIFIETVGVGQAELDVLTCVDLTVLVLQPGTGDVIQTLKAGIVEIADVFLVNKADLPGTGTLLESLRFLFEIRNPGASPAPPAPPILTASALRDQGLDEAHAEIERAVAGLVASGRLREKKIVQMEREIRDAIREDLWDRYLGLTGAREEIRAAAADLLENGRSPYPFIRTMCARVRMEALEDPACGARNE